MPAAHWVNSAERITARRAVADGYIELAELCRRVNLAEATVRDALSRSHVHGAHLPLSALSRPPAYIGGRVSPEPLWTEQQVEEYLRRAREVKAAGQGVPDLPEVSQDEANEQGLASIETLAARLGVAPNSLRRWANLNRHNDPADPAGSGLPPFPPEVAIAAREYPNQRGRQHRLRNAAAVEEWMRQYREQIRNRARRTEKLSA